MKKKLLLVGLLGMLSTGAFAFSGEFTTQIENYSYNKGLDNYDEGNYWLPGVGLKIKPIDESSFYLGGAFSRRTMTDNDKREADRRERTDLYVGKDFKFGDFTYSPKFLFRQENYETQESSTYGRYKKDFSEYKFYNGMKYKFNSNLTAFLSGYSALRVQSYRDRSGDKKEGTFKYNDYHHEYELGTTYKINDKNETTLSLYNEFYNCKDDRNKSETQIRVAHKYKINDKVAVTPYVRVGLQKDEFYKDSETGAVNAGIRHRFGIKGDYQVSPTFKLFAEAYLQPTDKHRESLKDGEVISNNKNNTQIERYIKVGFTQKF